MSQIKNPAVFYSGFKKLKTVLLRTVTLMTYYSILRSPDEHPLAALNMMMCRHPTSVV
jgi:hypothetical protein